LFVDYGNKYLAPAKPKWSNPPSRYKKPKKGRPRWDPSKKPGKKYMKPHVPKPRPSKAVPPQTQPYVAPATNPFRALNWVTRFAKIGYRISPHLRAVGYAWDAVSYFEGGWYRTAEKFTPAPGYSCYSYAPALDNPSVACNNGYWWGTFAYAGSGTNCNTWHYGAQALPGKNLYSRGFMRGPLLGGIYGCQRVNYAHVWIYPSGMPDAAKAPKVVPSFVTPLPNYNFDRFGDPLPEPQAEPEMAPILPMRPYEVPAMEYDPERSPPVEIVRHIQGRDFPGSPTKKRVVIKGGPVARVAGAVFGNATEGLDLANALWEALPKEKRTPYASQKQKVQDVWKHLDDVNWYDAGLNVALQQASDFIIGKLNKKAIAPYIKNGPAAKYWVRPTGPAAGSSRWGMPVGR